MEDLLKRLSEKHPDQLPIKRSKYISDCLIGRTKVWRAGKETITDAHSLYPSGSIPHYSKSTSKHTLVTRFWHILSRATCFTVGMGCKLILRVFNTTIVHGDHYLQEVLSRPEGKPLVSVFNHNSCFDDPGLMGAILSASQLADSKGMRWSVAASEVIYSNGPVSRFWALGKVIPVVRGWSAKQPAMDFLIDRLNEGSWVNIFPEAKVIDKKFEGIYKWGVGRLIRECKEGALFLPVFHVGMNQVLPNPSKPGEGQPLRFRTGNLVTVCIGEPIELGDSIAQVKHLPEQESWSYLTSKVQSAMQDLEQQARAFHKLNLINWLKRWHDEREVYFHILT